MSTETMERKRATKAVAQPVKPQQVARIVKMMPRTTPFQKSAQDRALAGTYRVIHGRIEIPRPMTERLNPDGSENVNVSKCVTAELGDEVFLGDEDAARMIDADIVEALDAKPSRVGKVWDPPKPVRNKNS